MDIHALLVELRRAAITQLAALETALGMERKCPTCGHTIPDKART